MRLVLASSNPGKLAEFEEIFMHSNFEIFPQSNFAIPDADETGTTFEANALIKARHASQLAGIPAIADDSGLEVDALNGKPGVRSARYAGEQASDQQNIAKLLDELEGILAEHRGARFQCVIAMVTNPDDANPVLCSASWEGTIATAAAGENGFGYDPVFCPDNYGCTTAQLSSSVKNSNSHRARALNQFRAALSQTSEIASH